MITATFIFRPMVEDAQFTELNATIRLVAEGTPGYLGRKAWHDGEGNEAVVYYWSDRADLEAFRQDATHQLAKSRYREWYAGYRVEIAEVVEVRGDGLFGDWPV